MVQKPDHLTQGLAFQRYIDVFIEYTTESAYCAALSTVEEHPHERKSIAPHRLEYTLQIHLSLGKYLISSLAEAVGLVCVICG